MWFLNRIIGSKATAADSEQMIKVKSVADEYRWIQQHCPGLRLVRQSLTKMHGKPCDELVLQNDKGEQRTIYFDISSFFGR